MAIHQYRTNLNCGSCVAAVTPFLDGDRSIRRWSVDTADPNKVLTVEGDDVSAENIERHVSTAGFRVLGKIETSRPDTPTVKMEEKSLLATYRPLLLVFTYLIGVVVLVEFKEGTFNGMRAMNNFMGGFFVFFSFFKLLDLRGFADAFQTYDILARPIRAYGYTYPFLELALGVAYLVGFVPVATNLATILIMLVGIVGITQALLKKQRIQCACLGTVFNLPMSTVTIVEDALMLVMAMGMLTTLLQ